MREEVEQLVAEAVQILGFVSAEWRSDPMSVQCFDLRIVKRAKDVLARLDELGYGS